MINYSQWQFFSIELLPNAPDADKTGTEIVRKQPIEKKKATKGWFKKSSEAGLRSFFGLIWKELTISFKFFNHER